MNNNYPNSNASRGSIDELIDLAKKEDLIIITLRQ